jgi:hypothetical protein
MPNALAVSTGLPNKKWAGGYSASPLKYRFSAITLFYFRVRWLLIWVSDCFVRQLAARHHSGFYPETWENNRLQ